MTKLEGKYEHSIDQIVILVEFCLNTTYFLCNGLFYRQITGAHMGSPVSSSIANAKMEDFKVKASAPYPPHRMSGTGM